MRTPRLLIIAAAALALLATPAPASAAPVQEPRLAPSASTSLPSATLRPARVVVAKKAKVSRVNLKIDARAGRHPISPLIYGVNFAGQTSGLSSAFHVPVDRWGGNSTSRYNYRNHTYNTGQDWYYENIVADPSDTLTSFIDKDRTAGTASLVTVPMIGWVAKDSPSAHPFACSFPRTSFATQNDFDPWDANCGNGVRGSTQLSADPSRTSISVGADFDHDMVASLVSRYGTAAQGGVKFYALDNEPVLWNSTHRDVHPDPLTSDELWNKSQAAAQAVKSADGTAAVLGPSDWGWCAYYFSAADECGQSTADRNAHGGLPLGAWYLQQFAAAERDGGVRLLDYFDEHFYPQGNNVALGKAGSSATKALRLRSTRALWDPSYVDESWISDADGRKPLQWIRTMKAWVSQYYPGTKTAITEYNWGGLESINGALAQADVLGIFGREGLDLATLWGPTKASDPWAYAFRMYLNYDGRHHRFGDTSVRASSANQGRLAVYAAVRSSDGALTVMVINKTGSTILSTLSLAGFVGASKAAVYRYSSAHPKAIVKKVSVKRHGSTISTSFAGSSITLLVLPKR
ncbi:glycosyl hydrolase family 44 [Propionicimonas paludicola]|uniref:Glycosyl hydrolase family 44 n=1 Tax=Propionicimonas paludicola TaxID=185243 RepID=A0A2A9CWQ5_9ACTN|nr:glycoside hydrolase family 44 protein [Propionicimonas paludicola]PFG18009.1 glycosyl hydrolase family 44 [Propionicimonas paludicola]